MQYKRIYDYIKLITEEFGLLVSIHFNSEFSRMFLEDEAKDLHYYNNHYNPYCMTVKSSAKGHEKCVECQKRVLKKCERVRKFTGVCHAGVKELIYAIECRGCVSGYLSISGYEGTVENEYLKREDIPEKLCDTLIYPLCMMLEQLCVKYSPKQETENDRILNYINSNYTHLNLNKLCMTFHKSKSSVSHSFKKQNGVTLSEYCNVLKLKDAEILLKTTDLSVTEICYTVGFESLSYFISCFKKKTGKTPLVFRRL